MQQLRRVEVEREGPHRFRIGWEPPASLAADACVVVTAGPRPDAIDHDRPLARVVGESEATVTYPGGEARPYFHVGVDGGPGVVAAERLVPLEGTMNFRDLGGYEVAGGGQVRWGRVFRSDGLALLSDADLRTVTALGIKVVHDFRYELERTRQPSRLVGHDGVEVVELAMGGPTAEQVEMLDAVLSGHITEVTVTEVAASYRALLEAEASAFGRLFTSLADPDRLPALFHCTAGKDRTGLAAALLLRLLGVGEGDVLDDYELSNRYRAVRRLQELRPRLEAAGVDVDKVWPFLSAPREALASALAWVEERYGSAAGYLAEAAGVADADLDRLRAELVDR